MPTKMKLKEASKGAGKGHVKRSESKGSASSPKKKTKPVEKQGRKVVEDTGQRQSKLLVRTALLAIAVVDAAIRIHDVAEAYGWAEKILKGIMSQFKAAARSVEVPQADTSSIEGLLEAQKMLQKMTEEYVHVINELMDAAEKISGDVQAGRLSQSQLGELQSTLLRTLEQREPRGGREQAVKAVMNAYLTAILPATKGKPRKPLKL